MTKRKRNPPVATDAYKQRSAKLIEAAQGEPMLLQDMAKILKTTYGGAQAQLSLLKKCGLPVPKVKRARHNGFNDNVKMPVSNRRAHTYYPSGLQVLSYRRDEETGQTIYLLR